MSNLLRDIRHIAYNRYKLFWLNDHGFDISALSKTADEWRSDCDDDISLEDYIEEHGVGSGALWPCYEEFLQTEYLNTGLMHYLLPRSIEQMTYNDDIAASFDLEEIGYVS